MDFPKALIIDDEKDTCLLLSSILKQKKINTTVAQSIADAKVALDKDVPDVVFLDNRLKDGLGLDFIPQILFNHPDLKIVLMTAYDTTADRENAFKKGAKYFIGKPFTRRIISDALKSLFTD